MAKIRVLRLLEYTYTSVERMEQDMSHWQIPTNGTWDAHGIVIRSAIIPLEILPVGAVKEESPDDQEDLSKDNHD
jgi:hypothetical protein